MNAVGYYHLSINNVKESETTSEKHRRIVSVYTTHDFNQVNTRDASDAAYRLHNQKRLVAPREEPTPHIYLRPRNSKSPAPRARLLPRLDWARLLGLRSASCQAGLLDLEEAGRRRGCGVLLTLCGRHLGLGVSHLLRRGFSTACLRPPWRTHDAAEGLLAGSRRRVVCGVSGLGGSTPRRGGVPARLVASFWTLAGMAYSYAYFAKWYEKWVKE
jgi:hypothetical protein